MSHRITVTAALTLVALVACQRMKPSEDLLAEARQHQARHEERAAVIQLKNLLQQEPGHGPARRLLAELHLSQGEPAAAEKEVRRAISLGQPRREVLRLLVQAMLMQQSHQAILDELAADSPDALVLAWRAHALSGLGKAQQAAQLYTEALQKDPGLVDAHLGQARQALQRNHADEAMRAVERAVASDQHSIEALRFKGDLLRARGDTALALRAYDGILRLQPSNVQAHADIAMLQLQAGHPDLARRQLAIVRKSQPSSLAVFYAQAVLDYAEGKPKSALEGAQAILRTAPDHPPSLLLAATVELALGAPAQARTYLARYRQANPSEPYAIRLLAMCALREGKPQESLALLEPLLEKHGEEVELLALAGEAAMHSGKHELAARWFGRASALAPESGSLLAASGLSLLGLGDGERALHVLQQAARKDGTAARAGALLVMTHLRNRQFDQAKQQVARMEGQGDNPAVQNLKGGVLLASADLAGARQAFARALALDPSHLPALENLAELDLLEKKPAIARQRYAAALGQQRKPLAILMALARLETRLGNLPGAIGWLEKAGQAEPDALPPARMLSALYIRAGQADKALQLAQRLQAATPADAASLDLLSQAQAAAGKHQAALESLQQLVLLQPDSTDVQMRLARTRLTLEDKDGALQAARRALLLDADREDALALASALMLDRRAHEDALRLARGAQERRPEAAIGFKLEGDAWLEQGKAGQALQHYERGFALQRSGPMMIALHRACHAAGKAAVGEQRMRAWLEANPADQPTRLYYASHLLQQAEFAAARQQYQHIVQRDPNNVVALNDLAWVSLQLKDGAALRLAERAYRLAPANPAVADTLAWILAEGGQPARALPLLKKALATAPSAADIRLHYALVLFRTGDRRSARAQCEQLLALGDFARRKEVQALMAKL